MGIYNLNENIIFICIKRREVVHSISHYNGILISTARDAGRKGRWNALLMDIGPERDFYSWPPDCREYFFLHPAIRDKASFLFHYAPPFGGRSKRWRFKA